MTGAPRGGHGRIAWLAVIAAFVGVPTAEAVEAEQNLCIDPHGRVVDVTFDSPVTLTAPQRFRFDIDDTRPLARDGSGFLGDLDGDGLRDLLLADFDGFVTFYPGLAGTPVRFGDGTLVRHTTTSAAEDPFRFVFNEAYWIAGDVGDLDGDGTVEVVMGSVVYALLPSLVLEARHALLASVLDTSASLGDLDDDGDLDVVTNINGNVRIHTNSSTPGSFSFTATLIGSSTTHHHALADLNGDGLLDLAGGAGIHYNTGTPSAPAFNLAAAPAPWVLPGSPASDWIPSSDRPTTLWLRDIDGDGLIDAYVSTLSDTVWSTVYYRNIGTPAAPVMAYVGPIRAASTPFGFYYHSQSSPSISGVRAFVVPGDVDEDGVLDHFVSNHRDFPTLSASVLWGIFRGGTHQLAYMDTYSWPTLFGILPSCNGGDLFCSPPDMVGAWQDFTGDGLDDELRIGRPTFAPLHTVTIRARTGTATLGSDVAVNTPTAGQVAAIGVAWVDVDLDGIPDLVAGAEDGRVLVYRDTDAGPGLALADPVPLTDTGGVPFDVGTRSWPAAFDLDGDGDQDFLVSAQGGTITRILCIAPGSPAGYAAGGLLGTLQQDPVDLTSGFGGGLLSPSLATVDFDEDGLNDVVAGTSSGHGWLLRNVGTTSAPVFALEPLVVTHTAAAFLEILDPTRVRVRFGVPTTAGVTVLSWRGVSGAPDGNVIVTAPPPACDDSNICTTDSCNTTTGCVHTPLTCVDGLACTSDVCDPASGCVNDPLPDGTVCRAAAGLCDAAETCDGTPSACPSDALAPAGTVCRAAAGPCDAVETCAGTAINCPGNALLPAGSVCRAAADVCDLAETCSGSSTSCPADLFRSSTTVCRASAGPCDLSESCPGSSASCPADAFRPSSFTCRASAGVCDAAETCTGSSAPCPADAFLPSTTECRASAGVCDAAETCTGSSAACPANGFEPATTICRAAAGACDLAETCTGSSSTCPANALAPAGTTCRAAAGPCDVAEACSGASSACPSDLFASATTVCRAAAGVCDVAESCTGGAASCPGDAFAPAATECRAAAGVCDVAESCTGGSASCPSDALAAAGTLCRPAAGDCDVDESCTGGSATCPSDAFAPATTECRPAAGVCDVADSCIGSAPSCPPDVLAPAGTICRPSTDACDPAELCTGGGVTCAADIDDDPDADLVCNPFDNCPLAANPGQDDSDGDGVGDVCDSTPTLDASLPDAAPVDAAVDALFDADPSAPDASSGAPDADPGAPDADPGAPDAGVGADAELSAPGTSGCDCRAARGRTPAASLAVLLALAWLLTGRRA